MIKKIINALLDQVWTLLGMFVAWVVLEGSARTLVTYAIFIVLVIDLTRRALQDGDKNE
jgi:hypothetical protein